MTTPHHTTSNHTTNDYDTNRQTTDRATVTSMTTHIKERAKAHLSEMKQLRRTIHQNPELAHEEFKTQALVRSVLDDLGIPNQPLAGTGVVGLIEGGHPGKTVLLRADMDALPVDEEADIPYISKVAHKMHACGHDGHTAGLLGAAMILNDLKDQLHGNVKLMFQPAEETDGGAKPMIDEGILENPTVSAAFGLHLAGDKNKGELWVKHGAMMGAPDEFEVTITGIGGHAAHPHDSIDPISLAAQFITEIQYMVARRFDPVKPIVVSITKVHAGDGLNVIPETCEIGGTLRTLYPETREKARQLIEKTLASICALNDASYTFNFMPSYPPVINDNDMTDVVVRALSDYAGEENVHEHIFPSLGAEDFAYLCEAVPSSYYNVGIKEPDGAPAIHHHPKFAWNDDVLEVTSATLAQIAYQYLEENS
ncbi:M20 metallopeptidase family protein [Bavariicoccus seileri]|uniref:M20 metallopeptidase family protein n=1 Tax=Bavariicoccus seileri TaxID=549685 RepID=UPI003F92AB22